MKMKLLRAKKCRRCQQSTSSEGQAWNGPSLPAPRGTDPGNTLISDVWHPELWDAGFCSVRRSACRALLHQPKRTKANGGLIRLFFLNSRSQISHNPSGCLFSAGALTLRCSSTRGTRHTEASGGFLVRGPSPGLSAACTHSPARQRRLAGCVSVLGT